MAETWLRIAVGETVRLLNLRYIERIDYLLGKEVRVHFHGLGTPLVIKSVAEPVAELLRLRVPSVANDAGGQGVATPEVALLSVAGYGSVEPAETVANAEQAERAGRWGALHGSDDDPAGHPSSPSLSPSSPLAPSAHTPVHMPTRNGSVVADGTSEETI